jgi:hypothetical protein
MNVKELSELLNGREYREEMTAEEQAQAKADRLVVVYGASDDIMVFQGAIDDEIGVYEGGIAYISKDGLLLNKCQEEDCPYFVETLRNAAEIKALWCEDDKFSWTYETKIPHESFIIHEDDQFYCKGIVFSLDDLI